MTRPGLVLLLLAAARPAVAQDAGFVPLRPDGNGVRALAETLTVALPRSTVREALQSVADRGGVSLIFQTDLPGLERTVRLSLTGTTVAAALLAAVDGAPLELMVSPSGQIVVTRRRPAGLSGTVTVAGGAPLGGATLWLAQDGLVTSDAAGRFAFAGLVPGRYTLYARAIGYAPARLDSLVLRPGVTTTVSVRLDPLVVALPDIVVTPGAFTALAQPAAAAATLTRDDIERRAQIGEDLFRAINRLPGISSNDFSAGFRVRGGAPDELYVELDGMQLHDPFHLKDIENALSIIDVQSIGSVRLATGGFGVERGGRLTGVLDMRSVAPTEPHRMILGLSATNARVMSLGRFGGDRGEWVVSLRRGYLDIALALAGGDDNLHPTYYDGFAKLRYQLGARHVVGVHAMHAGDALTYQEQDFEPRIDSRYRSSYAWATWDAEWGSLRTHTLAGGGRLSWHRSGTRVAERDGRPDLAAEDNRDFSYGEARQEFEVALGERALLRWGGRARAGDAHYDFQGMRRTLIAVDDTLGERVDTVTVAGLAPSRTDLGAFGAIRVRPVEPLTVEAGARWDHTDRPTESLVSPRVTAALALGDRTTLRASWGRYVQPQEPYQIAAADGDTALQLAQRSRQWSVGIERHLPADILLRVEGYRRDVASVWSRYLNLDNTLSAYPEAEPDRALVAPTAGRAWGVEVYLTQPSPRRLTWSVSYSRAGGWELVNGERVARVQDQPHTLYLDASYRLARGWQLSWAWQIHSGWPGTVATFQADTLANGQVLVTQTYPNLRAERVPVYHRLDVRITRDFPVRHGRLFAFIDVFNVYDRGNPRGYDYGINIDRSGTVRTFRSYDELVPRLPTFGVTWEF